MTSWFDTHLIIIYVLLAVAFWAGFKSLTTSNSKSSLVIFGLALGGAGILVFLRWYNAKLIKEAEEIQKQRDKLHKEIKENKKELKELENQDEYEQQKLSTMIEQKEILIGTREKAEQEMDAAGRELQESINDLKKKYNI